MWPDFFGNYVPLHGQYSVHLNLQSICVVSRSFFKKAPNQQKEQEIHPITENPNRADNKIFKLRTKNSHQEFIKIVDRKADISYCRVIMI